MEQWPSGEKIQRVELQPKFLPLAIRPIALRFEKEALKSFVERTDGLSLSDALEALEANEIRFRGRRECLIQVCFAGSRRAFDQDWLASALRAR